MRGAIFTLTIEEGYDAGLEPKPINSSWSMWLAGLQDRGLTNLPSQESCCWIIQDSWIDFADDCLCFKVEHADLPEVPEGGEFERRPLIKYAAPVPVDFGHMTDALKYALANFKPSGAPTPPPWPTAVHDMSIFDECADPRCDCRDLLNGHVPGCPYHKE